MGRTLWQVLGMILLVVGGQGAVRQLIDHTDAGLLGWVPGGFVVQLVGHLVITLVGVLLASWATRKVVTDPGPSRR